MKNLIETIGNRTHDLPTWASCWSNYLNRMMMHGLANVKGTEDVACGSSGNIVHDTGP